MKVLVGSLTFSRYRDFFLENISARKSQAQNVNAERGSANFWCITRQSQPSCLWRSRRSTCSASAEVESKKQGEARSFSQNLLCVQWNSYLHTSTVIRGAQRLQTRAEDFVHFTHTPRVRCGFESLNTGSSQC